jgi:hypothetical protein
MIIEGQGIRGQVKGDVRKNIADTFAIKEAHKAENILSALSGQPDGARGEMVFNFGRFGHSMSWEMFEGKPVIFDTQKGQKWDVTKEGLFEMQQKWGRMTNAEATRLDNIDLDMNFLARWATNNK